MIKKKKTTLTSVVTEMTVSQFVSGLHDDQLRGRVIERGAASKNNLEECFKVIRDCWRSMIDGKRQNLLQQEGWKSRGFERIMAFANHMNQVLKEYVSQGYGTQRTNNVDHLLEILLKQIQCNARTTMKIGFKNLSLINYFLQSLFQR
ncbi:hypothetical protein K3495_g13418 [Podosphaera aphanis]|nr:hypothetical protein K3495_g13418 [Podosphaera aphanis]